MRQLKLPGIAPLCGTGDAGWDHIPTPVAVGEYLVGDDFVWLCKACFNAMWPQGSCQINDSLLSVNRKDNQQKQ